MGIHKGGDAGPSTAPKNITLANEIEYPNLEVDEAEGGNAEGNIIVDEEVVLDAVNPYLHYFNGSPGSCNDFCEKYRILSDVQVALVTDPENMPFEEGRLNLPLCAITEGGVRFPLDPLWKLVLHTLNLTTSRLSGNMFRIIMGVVELRKRHDLIFGMLELFEIYSLSYNGAAGRRLFSVRGKYEHLVHTLPDSDPFINDFVTVMGNFMFGPDEPLTNSVRFDVGNAG